ncbi:hypothetical protein UR09_04995 [Candidatus Nitromaritima sp. SCGC AAA799-A02]|nr:hypothetical protein UR09_04995 [Candidatus Nitromaritima sp. SCGC AAA799-A02]
MYDSEIWNLCIDQLKRAQTVVDFGSGGGTLLYNVAQFTDAELIGVEQSDHAIAQSLELIPRMRPLKENILNTSLKDESVDFAMSTMVIEHIEENPFLSEVYRVLKPQGFFLVTSVIKKPNAWYFYKNASGESVLEPSHLREYKSLEQFENLIKGIGFSIIRSKTPRICFPLLDPFLKLLIRAFKLNNLMTRQPIEALRLATRAPIPGYFAVETLAQKPASFP